MVARLQAQCREITAKMRETTDDGRYQRLAKLWIGLQKKALELVLEKSPMCQPDPEAS